MKKLKLILAFIAILMFSNFLFAEKPLKDDADNLAGIMLEKLGNEIVLSDSQKVNILQINKVFIVKMHNANTAANENEKFILKKQASDEYKLILDNLLSKEQKDQVNIKCKERQDRVINKYQTKK